MIHAASFEEGRGRTRVHAELYRIGSELVVFVGGEGPHVGAVTIAERGPGGEILLNGATSPRHRERELTDRVARALVEAHGRKAMAFSGIHLDRITREEIEEIRSNVRILTERLVEAVRADRRQDEIP